MSKKNIVKDYLQNAVDWEGLQREYNNSWIYGKLNLLPTNGLTTKYITYNTVVRAIDIANYKYPDSDRTWQTINNIVVELIKENID